MTTALTVGINQLKQGEVYALPGMPCQILSSLYLVTHSGTTNLFNPEIEPGVFIDGGNIQSPSGNATVVIKKHTIGKNNAATKYEAAVLLDKPSYYWRLNETLGHTVASERIQGLNGTISGGVTLNQPGALVDGDKCMVFDGVSGKIVTAGQATIPVPFSFECWYKSSLAGETPLFGTLGGPGALGIAVLSSIQFYPYIQYTDATAEFISFTHGLQCNLNQWHHYVMVVLDRTLLFYLDGIASVPYLLSKSVKTPITAKLCIPEQGSIYGSWYNGAIDEVAIYPRALTAAEILEHYKAR